MRQQLSNPFCTTKNVNELSPDKLQYRAGTIYREAGMDVKTIYLFDMHSRAAHLCMLVCVCNCVMKVYGFFKSYFSFWINILKSNWILKEGFISNY